MVEPDRRGDARSGRGTWIAAGILVALIAAFAAYYYYDRYVTPAGVAETPDPVEQLEKAILEKPDDPDLRLNLAESYLLNRRYDDAVKQAEQVLEAYPKKDRALLLAGVAYSLNGQAEEALAPLGKFIKIRSKAEGSALDTSLEAALYYQGDSLIKLGKPADAIEPLEHAVKISPTDADALYMLGTAYAAAGKHAKAIPMFERAVELVPDFRESYEAMAASFDATGRQLLGDYARAMVSYSMKDYAAARDKLRDFVAKKKDFTPAYLGLGLAYEQLGDLKNAKSNLTTARKREPASIAIQQALGRVEATIQQQAGS